MQKLHRPSIGTLIVVIACVVASMSSLPVAGAQQGLQQSPSTSVGTTAPAPPAEAPPTAPIAVPVDATPPWIAQPTDIVAAAYDASGAVVTYLLPAAGDDSGNPVTVACDRISGALFPLGQSVVTCSTMDAAGNVAAVTFRVTVTDQTAPVIPAMANIVVDASDPAGAVVAFSAPVAWDNVGGNTVAVCDPGSGTFFAVGTTMATCYASDAAGNKAQPVTFSVTVNAPVVPPTVVPEPTAAATLPPAPTSVAAEDVVPTVEPTAAPPLPPTTDLKDGVDTDPTATVEPALTPTTPASTPLPSPTATPSPTLEPTVSPTAVPTEPAPDAMDLPWPPPGNFVINTYGGPLNGIDAIWGYGEYPISQEFGHTEFSISHFSWYAYGIAFGLDGYQHPGLDVGMPAGTWLYSPVEGTVRTSGNTPYYTYYGNGSPNVGELRIETDDGHEVILGHMGAISVNVGDRVEVGQFVGVSGGFNGDHLHLEVLEAQWGGWHLAVDPRKSFIVDVLEDAAKAREAESGIETVLPGHRGRSVESGRRQAVAFA